MLRSCPLPQLPHAAAHTYSARCRHEPSFPPCKHFLERRPLAASCSSRRRTTRSSRVHSPLVFGDYFDLLQSVIGLIERPAAELAALCVAFSFKRGFGLSTNCIVPVCLAEAQTPLSGLAMREIFHWNQPGKTWSVF